MKIEALKKLLSLGESEKVEFKTNYNPRFAGIEVCAFLNSKGGYLVCGIDDSGAVSGINLNDEISEIEMNLSSQISPKAPVFFELHEIEGKTILVIEVPAGKDVPYSFMDDIFIRVKDKTKKADIETIREMIIRRQSEPERWERRFSDAQIELDLDSNHLGSVANEIRKSGRYKIEDNKENQILESLSVAKYGRLTNAGDVLFCKNTARRYPQVRVKAASFTTGKADKTFKDFKYFEGPLLLVLEDVYAFIVRNTPTKAHFSKDSLLRKDEPLYPAEAVREGLVNAFAHRDYADFRGSLSVFIYPDRLEISNSGEFPEGVTAKKLNKGHISVLRNPDIAHVLYLRGMMEKTGRGSVLIQEFCEKSGLPKPVWRSEKNIGVTLILTAPQVTPPVTPQVTPQVTPPVKALLNLLLEKGDMSANEIRNGLQLKDRTHVREHYINPALEAQFIEPTIPDKPTSRFQKYHLTETGKKAAKE